MNTSEELNAERKLSVTQYLNALHLEYINSWIREKIYTSEKDKKYHSKVMQFKKDRIQTISNQNQVPNMFVYENLRPYYEQQIIKEFGFPNFYYRGEKDITEFASKDLTYYYFIGSEVRVNIDKTIVVGTIESTDLANKIIFIKLREQAEARPFKADFVTRILE